MSKIDQDLSPNSAEERSSHEHGGEADGREESGAAGKHQSEFVSGAPRDGMGVRERPEATTVAERGKWLEEVEVEAERTHKLLRLAEEVSRTLGARQRFETAKAQGLRATAVCSIFSRQNEATNARLQIVRDRGRKGVAPRARHGVEGDDEEEAPPGWWGRYHDTRNSYLKGRESGHKMMFRKEWGVRQQRKKELWRMRREVRGEEGLLERRRDWMFVCNLTQSWVEVCRPPGRRASGLGVQASGSPSVCLSVCLSGLRLNLTS